MYIKWIIFIISLYLSGNEVNGVEYNLALNQNVTTSNVVPNYPASNAIDQKLSTYVQVDYVEGVPAWILINLRLYVFISKIIIWPTNDADFVLAKVAIYLTYARTIRNYANELTCVYDNPVKGVSYNCTKPKGTTVGYVHLLKESFFNNENLKIAEIGIISFDSESRFKQWKSAQQSNEITGAGLNGPENIFDDSLGSCIYTDQSDINKQNIRGWWQTDLGQKFNIFGFNIFDSFTKNQSYRGNYLLYIDTDGFTKKDLCAYDNQTLARDPKFVYCNFEITGRYITIERVVTNPEANRTDMLTFCDISIALYSNERAYTSPQNYIYTPPDDLSTPSASTTTTATTTTSTTSTTTTTTTTSSIIAYATTNTATIGDSLIKEKIIIGVVTGVLAAVLFGLIFGIICYMLGSLIQRKKLTKQIIENTVNNNNTYSEISETAMNTNNAYNTTIE